MAKLHRKLSLKCVYVFHSSAGSFRCTRKVRTTLTTTTTTTTTRRPSSDYSSRYTTQQNYGRTQPCMPGFERNFLGACVGEFKRFIMENVRYRTKCLGNLLVCAFQRALKKSEICQTIFLFLFFEIFDAFDEKFDNLTFLESFETIFIIYFLDYSKIKYFL